MKLYFALEQKDDGSWIAQAYQRHEDGVITMARVEAETPTVAVIRATEAARGGLSEAAL